MVLKKFVIEFGYWFVGLQGGSIHISDTDGANYLKNTHFFQCQKKILDNDVNMGTWRSLNSLHQEKIVDMN